MKGVDLPCVTTSEQGGGVCGDWFQLNVSKDFQIIPYAKNGNDKQGLDSHPDKEFWRRFLLLARG